jgi:hypothetical protein
MWSSPGNLPWRHWVEERYSSTLSLTSALNGRGWLTPRPDGVLPGMTRYPLYKRLGGPQGRSGRVQKISRPTRSRTPDRPARSESLYRLCYPGPFSFSEQTFAQAMYLQDISLGTMVVAPKQTWTTAVGSWTPKTQSTKVLVPKQSWTTAVGSWTPKTQSTRVREPKQSWTTAVGSWTPKIQSTKVREPKQICTIAVRSWTPRNERRSTVKPPWPARRCTGYVGCQRWAGLVFPWPIVVL